MGNGELKFIIPMHDIDVEKKYIVGKLTNGKHLGDYPKLTDYAVLNGLKTNIIPNQLIYSEYWLAYEKEVYESPRERDDPPDHYIQETSSYGALPNDKTVGIKPAIKYSDIKRLCEIKDTYIYPIFYKRDEEYLFVEFGEYPQNIVDNNLSNLLTQLYQENKLIQTGNVFSRDIGNPNDGMKCLKEEVYEFNGEKYVRALNLNPEGILSNGHKAGNKEYYWVKVEPVIWFVDKKENLAITDKIIIGGVAYNSYETCLYEETYACKFIDEYFSKELTQNIKTKELINNSKPVQKVKVKRIQ